MDHGQQPFKDGFGDSDRLLLLLELFIGAEEDLAYRATKSDTVKPDDMLMAQGFQQHDLPHGCGRNTLPFLL